jgi:hypothetical protein
MQTTKLDGKLDTDEVTIIGNDNHSNAKQIKSKNVVCYDCGKKFETTDKEATICPNCITLYNKSKETPVIYTWKPQPITMYPHKNIFIGGMGLFFIISFIIILKGCLGILGS